VHTRDLLSTNDRGPTLNGPVVPPSIERGLEPVVVAGADLPDLAGAPTDSLFVYAYRDGGLQQIPFQVDEVVSGAYAPTEGSPLDADDEVVFMASDLGARLLDEQFAATLPISPTWYRIEVTDPLSPTAQGWAYVVRSSSLTKTFTQTYASFDPATDQITTTQYALGFLSGHPGFDTLALHGSAEDILDRTKVRVETPIVTLTEQNLPAPEPTAIKDGPVRVIVQNRGIMGYRSMLYTWVAEDLLGATAARLSTDFNENATGATLYNAVTPTGLTIDGNPDVIVEAPVSPWWEVIDDTGSLVQVADSSGVGGTQTNYYKDDDTTDPADTGDGKSYGDTGILVQSPNETVTYQTVLYVLPPGQPSMGALFAAYAASPLQVTATAPVAHRAYLPLVLRLWPPFPGTPTLQAIDNRDGDGAYDICWSAAGAATAYVLQEARTSDLSDATTVYTGTALSYTADGRGAARYCYRVKARNSWGDSDWSNVESVDVLWEAEPNDEAGQANGPLVSGVTYYGNFPGGADERDWFAFDLSTAHDLELWLTHIPFGHDYDLLLRDASLELVAVSAAYGSVAEQIVTDALAPGRYYIEVVNYSESGSTQAYQLNAAYEDGG
jgi:hypothetical protein